MPGSVFPSLVGQSWSIVRTPMWQTRVQTSVSGLETRLADWSYPRYKWSLTFDLLRPAPAFTELQQLMGFYNLCQGSWDTFLYTDDTDYSVTNQTFATGDGTTTAFQLVKEFGGFAEPVLAPNTVTTVTDAGSTVSPSDYTVNANTGIITFNYAPTSGDTLAATFTYYYRCRFTADSFDFEEFMYGYWSMKKLEFMSVKETNS